MRGKVHLWGFILLSLLIVSCGKTTRTRSSSNVSPYKRQSIHPILLSKQFNNCPQIYRHSNNTKFQIEQYLDGQYVLRTLNMKNILQDQVIQSNSPLNAVGSTSSDFESEKEYAMDYDSSIDQWRPTNLIYSNKIINKGSHVKLCPGNTTYKSMTVENAAISIGHTINKTKQRIKSSLPTQTIAPIDIKVTPLLGKKYIGHHQGKEHHLKLYDTDNAFYRPSDRTIQFLPQSKEGLEQNVFGRIPLWEIPMVASHEYGHHIFTELYPRYITLYYAHHKNESQYCFHAGKEIKSIDDKKQITKSLRKRSVNYLLFVRSINEAFADLISFYALDNTERGLKNISCMQINREVDRSHFQDGTAKIYNAKVYKQFNSLYKQGDDGSCTTPNFQHIHTVGAIFAHATDQILSLLTNSKGDKLSIVLKWAKALNKNHNHLKGIATDQLYESLYSLMGKVALEHMQKPTNKIFCESIKAYYPRSEFYHNSNYLTECDQFTM